MKVYMGNIMSIYFEFKLSFNDVVEKKNCFFVIHPFIYHLHFYIHQNK